MKYLLFVILLFFYNIGTFQKIEEGLYINAVTNEFVYLFQDSIMFRLNNYDAFGAFSIGKGLYKSNGKDNYCIQQCESVKELTSYIKKIQRNDSLIAIRIGYNDTTPIQSAYAYIKEVDIYQHNFEFIGISDADGMITVSEDIIKRIVDKKEFVLKIIALGFSTEKRLFFKRGLDFMVYSKIPIKYPFVFFNSGKLIIKDDDLEGIVVEISRKKKVRKRYGSSKLIKAETETLPIGFFFDKDVAEIYRK